MKNSTPHNPITLLVSPKCRELLAKILSVYASVGDSRALQHTCAALQAKCPDKQFLEIATMCEEDEKEEMGEYAFFHQIALTRIIQENTELEP
jgi:hypothetical protein